MSTAELHHARELARRSTHDLENALDHLKVVVAADAERLSARVTTLRDRSKYWVGAFLFGSVLVNFALVWGLSRMQVTRQQARVGRLYL